MTDSFDTFADALASLGFEDPSELEESGKSINGTALSETQFKYFVTDAGTSDEDIHHMAFQIRNGRPISEYELWVRDLAKKRAS